MSKKSIPNKFKKPKPVIVVKSTAKTVRGRLNAIIAQHLVCNWPDDGDIVLLHGRAVEYILKEFNVIKKDSE